MAEIRAHGIMMPPENRKNIKDRNTKGDEYGFTDANQGESHRQLHESDTHNQSVGTDTDKKGADHVLLDLHHDILGLFI